MDKRRKRAEKEKKRQQARARSAAKAAPSADDVEGHVARAYKALTMGNPEKAEKITRAALRAHPDHFKLLSNLAAALDRQGKTDDAYAVAVRCAEAHPDVAQVQNNLGALLKFRGDLEGARERFRRAVTLDPKHAEAWRNLGSVRRVEDPADPDLEAMRALLEALPQRDAGRVHLYFALAKAHEELAAYEEAFEHYAKGNRLKRAGLSFSVEAVTGLMRDTAAAHGPDWFAPGPLEGAPTDAPILVLGMPRSGSTLVEQILASHPLVEGVGEVLDLTDVQRGRLRPGEIPAQLTAGLDDPELVRLARAYLTKLQARAPGAARIVDKCLQNFLHVGFVARALPNARIVHSVRDPIDNCLSCFRVHFTSEVSFTYDLRELGEYYQALRALMDHWHAQLPGRILDVQYEQLVADQEGQTRRLLEFCGLDWDPACLAFHETTRRVDSASSAQVRKPLYATSVERWRRYEAHLDPLREALGPLS